MTFAPGRLGMTFTSALRVRGVTALTAADFPVSLQLSKIYGIEPPIEINMLVNADTVKWVLPKRITKKDTRTGSTYFHFTNTQGQNNDILTLEFNGNTGILDQRSQTTEAQAKLAAWQNLYLLSREPMLLADNTENVITIIYTSVLFPFTVYFRGHFAKVVEFSEDGKKPHSRDYSFTFTVQSTSPSLDTILAEMQAINSAANVPIPAVPAVPTPAVPTQTEIPTNNDSRFGSVGNPVGPALGPLP